MSNPWDEWKRAQLEKQSAGQGGIQLDVSARELNLPTEKHPVTPEEEHYIEALQHFRKEEV